MRLSLKPAFIIFSLFTGLQSFAQENKKEVKKLSEEAFEYYKIGQTGNIGAYHKALNIFLKADSLQPNDPSLCYSIGLCYSNVDQKLAALPYLEKAKKGKVDYPDLNFNLACSYHLAHRFQEALLLFRLYRSQATKEEYEEIDGFIYNCETGIELLKNPVDAKITNLGPTVNSKFPDYHPSISADEKTLIFISRRDNTTGGLIDIQDNHYFEDIYLSNKVNRVWTPPIDLGNGINTPSHDGSVGLSADGQELFIYRWSKESHGDLFVSDLAGTEWSFPKHLGDNINSKLWESDVSVTPDKKIIFFTSDRKSGKGGRDIYMARRLSNGEYAKPFNLGAKINTKFDEDAPFIHPDGKTLYFSSRGHKSMGGYDIFSCTINLETGAILTDPVNVGYPINTADDDVFFVWSADNKRAYFASERAGGYGEKDIYLLERTDVEAALVVLKGIITSCGKNLPISAKITVIDNSTQQILGTYTSNSSSGNYIVILPTGKNYAITVESPGYLFHSKNIDVTTLEHYQEIDDETCLEQLKVGTKIVLRNVFFDIDKAELRKESEAELARLLEILQNNKNINIQISGHTDSDGNEEHNLKLSEDRANAVFEYLINKGIERYRLSFKGYGETKPIVENDSREHKQLNRRTEIEITEYLVK
jgi:outer membrane protein OmpA-like peptidoglycan-associated protein/tetratricopeptide (TPR) repeat protein